MGHRYKPEGTSSPRPIVGELTTAALLVTEIAPTERLDCLNAFLIIFTVDPQIIEKKKQ